MRRLVIGMLVVALVLDTAYWSIWFTHRDWLASLHTDAYYQFENAFPLADAWLALCCAGALNALLRRSRSATFWLVAAGAAGLYLGCMDLLYDLEHAVFTRGSGGAVEAAIVLLTWTFAITALRYASALQRPATAGPAAARQVSATRGASGTGA